MSYNTNCPCNETCPHQRAMEMIEGKWRLSLLCSISVDRTVHYNELLREIRGILNTMLARFLQELERNELVRRLECLKVPIRVEYEATDKTKELAHILAQHTGWAAKQYGKR